MINSYNDSGLIAKRSYKLLSAGLTAIAVFLSSCHTSSQVPIDDAYYWPESSASHMHSHGEAVPSDAPDTPDTPNTSIEYLNVQDTTVTIRIKR